MTVDYTNMSGPELHSACGVDAAKWAAAFRQYAVKLGYSDMDEGWLIGWFANPIMAMHDQCMAIRAINGDHAQYLIDRAAKEQENG